MTDGEPHPQDGRPPLADADHDRAAGDGASTGASDAVGEVPDGDAAHAVAVAGPKMVRRVVCSYQLGWLPGDWLQTWRRLDRVFARADLKVKATLAPLEDLPDDTDILIVPPELREAAHEAARPGTPILVTPVSAAAGAFADLVARLQADKEFTAEKVSADEKDAPTAASGAAGNDPPLTHAGGSM